MDKKQYVLTVVLSMITGLVGGVVSSFLFVGTPVFAQKTEVAEVIMAKVFMVVDENRKGRAALGLVKGEPRLQLYDKDGKTGAMLGLNKGEPGLGFYDQNGKGRAGLALNKDGEPGLALRDQNGKTIWSAP